MTTGIPAIDYFISAGVLEPSGAEGHYSGQLVRLTNSPTCYRRPARTDRPLDRERFGLPSDATLYLCPQSLFKFHPDFDLALAGILRRDKNAHVLLIRGRQPHLEELLKERFARSIGEMSARIVFFDPFRGADFFRLLLSIGVMLDPLHFGGGNSTYEALAIGTPIVTMPGEFMRGRVTYACYERMRMKELIANDVDAYVDIATRVANDRRWRTTLSQQISDRCSVLFDDRGVVRELEDFLLNAHSAKVSASF